MANVIKAQKEWLSSRDVLWYLVFTGFAINYMVRINLNIAIVSMVKPRPKNNVSLTSECIAENTNVSLPQENEHNITSLILGSNVSDSIMRNESQLSDTDKVPTFEGFDWNEREQGSILGSYFWLHWTTQIPGGILAGKYGTKLVFGLSNFISGMLCVLMPMASYLGYRHLLFVRCLQGIIAGFAWPAMHNMTARWIPPNERSKFVTAYLGSSVGAALTFPICGYIIHSWGWELVFYVSGAFTCLWYVAWRFLVYDSPTVHPRISENEKQYILKSLGESYAKEKPPVPWKDLLTSMPLLMNVLAQWGGVWGLFTLMTHSPTYFKMIHGWDIRAAGIFSGLPHMLRMIWAYIYSKFSDYLLTSEKMNRTNVRKLATFVCVVGQGFCMLALSFAGCNGTMAIVFLTAATAIHGAVSSGPLASVVDLSPNYAGVALGIINTVVALVGFLAPMAVGYLTFQNQTIGQWQKVFWLASVILLIPGVLYMFFSKSTLQPWNSPERKKKEDNASELVTLKTKSAEDYDVSK